MKNNKSLGQHWLKNRAILEQIADLALLSVDSHPICLEIGPGLGTLTSSLLKRFDQVIAVEYDAQLAANLPKSFPGTNLNVVHDDILTVDFNRLIGNQTFVVVGNIPYYITSPIITKLLTSNPTPVRIVLLIQKEVAKRIAATPGHYTFLSLFAQNYATVTLGPEVNREEFTPPPLVDSQVIVLETHTPVISAQILAFARKCFSQPRKKLTAVLATFYPGGKPEAREAIISLNLNPDARPSDLSHQDWERLFSQIYSRSHP